MIIDTTYLLPLAKINVRYDLLKAIALGKLKIDLGFEDLKVSLISLFELQAKAWKIGVPPDYVLKAVNAVIRNFEVVPFYHSKVVNVTYELRDLLEDFIDCIIIATAVAFKEDLITEDRDILSLRKLMAERYNVSVLRYNDVALPCQ